MPSKPLIRTMPSLLLSLPIATSIFQSLAARIVGLYEQQPTLARHRTAPPQLLEGIDQLLSIASQLDMSRDTAEAVALEDVSQLGEYGFNLISELEEWLSKHGDKDDRKDIKKIVLAITDWVIRHDGQLQTLEPIIDALAFAANNTSDPAKLTELADFMGKVANACTPAIKNDLEQTNPGRPWRVLHLNQCITATRTHNTKRMEAAYDQLVKTLPQDAPAFFAEGVHEMDKLDYPPHVREVVQRYFDRFTRRRMN